VEAPLLHYAKMLYEYTGVGGIAQECIPYWQQATLRCADSRDEAINVNTVIPEMIPWRMLRRETF
jgi:hypothetical protein